MTDSGNKRPFLSSLTLLVIALIVYFFVRGIDKIFEAKPESSSSPQPSISILPSEYPDYEAFSSLVSHSLVLVLDQESYTPKDKPKIGRLDKTILVSGKLTRGYIYIETSVDYGKPLSQFDSIYMTMNGTGGHLLRSESLKVPGDHITKLLYGLDQIPVIKIPYSDTKKATVLNWFRYFVSDNKISFDTFLSSLRPGGKINKVEIRYECETGSECAVQIK